MRDARAVMHAWIANYRFPLKSVVGKMFPTFPAHAQPVILRIWYEAHWHTLNKPFKYPSRLYAGPDSCVCHFPFDRCHHSPAATAPRKQKFWNTMEIMERKNGLVTRRPAVGVTLPMCSVSAFSLFFSTVKTHISQWMWLKEFYRYYYKEIFCPGKISQHGFYNLHPRSYDNSSS